MSRLEAARAAFRGFPRISGYERVDKDWYVEPRWLVGQILDVETFTGAILDPCCGSGTIVSVCRDRGLEASGSDIVDRGFGTAVADLFALRGPIENVITNPPFAGIERVARHLLPLVRCKAAMIAPLTFLEAAERHRFFTADHPPVRVWICSSRPSMPPGVVTGQRDFTGAIVQPEGRGGKLPYCVAIWENGHRGDTALKWLPPRRKGGGDSDDADARFTELRRHTAIMQERAARELAHLADRVDEIAGNVDDLQDDIRMLADKVDALTKALVADRKPRAKGGRR